VNTVALDSRQISASEEEFLATNKSLTEKIFAGKGAEKISFEDFL
jgi:Ca2+-binding EF-hand superfamily protein